jgi:hypothetical protein
MSAKGVTKAAAIATLESVTDKRSPRCGATALTGDTSACEAGDDNERRSCPGSIFAAGENGGRASVVDTSVDCRVMVGSVAQRDMDAAPGSASGHVATVNTPLSRTVPATTSPSELCAVADVAAVAVVPFVVAGSPGTETSAKNVRDGRRVPPASLTAPDDDDDGPSGGRDVDSM